MRNLWFGPLALLFLFLLISSVSARVGGGDITFKVKSAGNVVFSHENHFENDFTCTECHDSLFVTTENHQTSTMKDMQNRKSCGACHNGEMAFNVKDGCNICHQK